MKPIEEIIEAAVGEDGVFDLSVAIEAATEEIRKSNIEITPAMSVQGFIEAQASINEYVGDLILSVADEVNALPKGIEQEQKTFSAFLTWSNLLPLYQLIAKQHKTSGLHIVQGEVPPLDSGSLRNDE